MRSAYPRVWQWLAGAALPFMFAVILTACSAASQPAGQLDSQLASQPSSTPCPTPVPESAAPGFCGAAPTNSILAAVTEAITPAGPPNQVQPTIATLPPTAAVQTPTLAATPSPCAAQQCNYSGVLVFTRPIQPPGQDSVDVTYRFGSTQGKTRDPHHGVEFLNGYGTPVFAAGDGVVVVAGDDRKTLYGPYSNFYGNLVILEHELPGHPQPIYSLYAHLSEVLVTPGQKIQAGAEIGRVGMTGVATGSHLHFEVRPGENAYAASSNPELWLAAHQDQEGQPHGALAGRVVDQRGNPIAVKDIVIQHLPEGEAGLADWEVYLESYEEKALLGRAPWYESFAAGDLPAGWYRITFPYYGLQSQVVQVFPDQLTIVNFLVD